MLAADAQAKIRTPGLEGLGDRAFDLEPRARTGGTELDRPRLHWRNEASGRAAGRRDTEGALSDLALYAQVDRLIGGDRNRACIDSETVRAFFVAQVPRKIRDVVVFVLFDQAAGEAVRTEGGQRTARQSHELAELLAADRKVQVCVCLIDVALHLEGCARRAQLHLQRPRPAGHDQVGQGATKQG